MTVTGGAVKVLSIECCDFRGKSLHQWKIRQVMPGDDLSTKKDESQQGKLLTVRTRALADRTVTWSHVVLISLGGFFEFYDIFFAGYVAPGLVRSGILTASTGIARFVAAMFSGLFIGTALVSFVADRFGRRTVFTYSLLWYTLASVIMAFQHDAFGLNLWRF